MTEKKSFKEIIVTAISDLILFFIFSGILMILWNSIQVKFNLPEVNYTESMIVLMIGNLLAGRMK